MFLTPEQKQRAMALHAEGYSWIKVSLFIGVTIHKIRMDCCPGFRETMRAKNKSYQQKLKCQRETFSASEVAPVFHIDVPPPVLEDRERRCSLIPADITAMLCGDPLPGYSALDRKQADKAAVP